jgi:hypothetical protein
VRRRGGAFLLSVAVAHAHTRPAPLLLLRIAWAAVTRVTEITDGPRHK